MVVPVGKGHCRAYPYIPGPPTKLRTKNKVLKQGKEALQSATCVGILNLIGAIYMQIYIYQK